MKFLTVTALLYILSQPSSSIESSDTLPDKESVTNFVKWAATESPPPGAENGVVLACDPKAQTTPKQACLTAQLHGKPVSGGGSGPGTADNWTEMCNALDNFDCDSQDPTPKDAVDDFTHCCSDTTPGKCQDTSTYTDGQTQVKCCATCISGAIPTVPPAPPAPSDPSSEESGSGDTTEETGETTTAPTPSPGPSPTPSSSDSGDDVTTTMEPSTTEGGSDSDSAINFGASGLLVTLITMMAAGVNIA